jgi:hypothetical protein
MIPHKPLDGAAGTCPKTNKGHNNTSVNSDLNRRDIFLFFRFN